MGAVLRRLRAGAGQRLSHVEKMLPTVHDREREYASLARGVTSELRYLKIEHRAATMSQPLMRLDACRPFLCMPD